MVVEMRDGLRWQGFMNVILVAIEDGVLYEGGNVVNIFFLRVVMAIYLGDFLDNPCNDGPDWFTVWFHRQCHESIHDAI